MNRYMLLLLLSAKKQNRRAFSNNAFCTSAYAVLLDDSPEQRATYVPTLPIAAHNLHL